MLNFGYNSKLWMIKTVIKTIFVLSTVVSIGIFPRDIFAAEKASCTSLSQYITLLPQIKTPTQSHSLYLPMQESYFRKQPPSQSLATQGIKKVEFSAEIGESEVIDTPESLTPLPTETPSTTPVEPITANPDGSLSADTLFAMANTARANAGLPAFEKDERICSVAISRGPELYNEIMVTHTMHAGFYARNLPYFATENVISMRTDQEAFAWWMNSAVHRSAILGDYQYACVACYGNSCAMIFTNFTPKQSISEPTATPSTQ